MSSNLRNFAIISHIDHGKSTLADRFLELTSTVGERIMQEQFLDNMELERERGITIKMRPVRMVYRPSREESAEVEYILNLIDTPGHVDFSYEVSRSLMAVEGVVLLVDASKGIQAQTLANLELAKNRGENFVIIPVINKIDLESARIKETKQEIIETLGVAGEEILEISAKEGKNIESVLKAVVERIPSPVEKRGSLRALIFDSEYDAYKGVIAHIRLMEGEVETGERIHLFAGEVTGEAKELGFFSPNRSPQKKLTAGEIGYIATGIKEVGVVKTGDTISRQGESITPLEGYREPEPMVFSSLYPKESKDYGAFYNALYEMKLIDPALTFVPEFREVFGRGFRCGFLGSLHSEIVCERLRRDYGLNLIISAPSVNFKIIKRNGSEEEVRSASDWPDESEIAEKKEPWVRLEIITPESVLGSVTDVLSRLSGKYVDTRFLSAERVLIIFDTPLRKVVTGLHDNLKSATRGYASYGYKIIGFYSANLVKMEILIAHRVEEAFSVILPLNEAYSAGKKILERLKENIPPHQFSVALQARVGGKIIARETIKARRKDVTGDLYGGDVTRKKKLLEKQKKGKKRLEKEGRVSIPQEAYFRAFR